MGRDSCITFQNHKYFLGTLLSIKIFFGHRILADFKLVSVSYEIHRSVIHIFTPADFRLNSSPEVNAIE